MQTDVIVEIIFLPECIQYNFKVNHKIINNLIKSNKLKPTSNLRIEVMKFADAMINIENKYGGEGNVFFEYVYYRNEIEYQNKEQFDFVSTKDIDNEFKKIRRKEIQRKENTK